MAPKVRLTVTLAVPADSPLLAGRNPQEALVAFALYASGYHTGPDATYARSLKR